MSAAKPIAEVQIPAREIKPGDVVWFGVLKATVAAVHGGVYGTVLVFHDRHPLHFVPTDYVTVSHTRASLDT